MGCSMGLAGRDVLHITLTKESERSFGVNLRRLKNGKIVVRSVDEGSFLDRWNSEHPHQDVAPGDWVLCVNGTIAKTAWQSWCTCLLVCDSVSLTVVREKTRPAKSRDESEKLEEFLAKLDTDVTTTVDTTCAICLEEMKEGEDLVVLPCRHAFHRQCAESWLERCRYLKAARCPTCRKAPVDFSTGEPCCPYWSTESEGRSLSPASAEVGVIHDI